MAEIDGSGLHFESTLDNDKLNALVEETLRRVQGLSDGITTAGEVMDRVFGDVTQAVSEASGDIDKAFKLIDQAADMNRQSLRDLEIEYSRLSDVAGKAFMSGDDEAYRQTVRQQDAVKGEIAVRRQLLNELGQQADELSKVEQAYEKERQKAEKSAQSQNSLRTQIRNVRDEMALLRNEADKSGVMLDENTGRYAELRNELGRLSTIQADMQKQAAVLSKTQEKQFQGIVSGLSGIAGGFSAATGAVSLFAGRNEDLQKVMTRVQSVMAITIGLQQVSQTLYKDSAFQLVTVARAKNMLAAATNRLSVALGISNVAAKALMATLTLGLSLAITGIIFITEKYISKTRAAKKEQEEFFKSIAENVYKPIGAIQMLSERWNQLGDNLEAKRKFIQDNKKDFEDLGWAVKGVEDAERVLSSPEHLQRFIDAQMAKARAMIYTEQAYENLKKQIELQQKLDEIPKFNTIKTGGGPIGTQDETVKNWRYKLVEDELNKLNETITKGYADAIEQEKLGAKILKELGIESSEAYADGSIGALENAIKEKNDLLIKATSGPERSALRKEIDNMQKEIERMTGKGGETKATGKDTLTEALEKRKAQYDEYAKYLNSTDEEVQKSAKTTFAEILKGGETYLEYLKKQRDALTDGKQTSTVAENLKKLNSAIASETQKEKDKEEIKNQEHVKKLIDDYGKYYDERVRLHEEYLKDIDALNKQLETETDPKKKETVKTAIDNRKKTYDSDLKSFGSGDAEYDAMLKDYATFEQKRQAIADEYAEKRKKAQEKGNSALVEELNKAEQKQVESLSVDELMSSDNWTKLFSNLDNLTVEKMIELRNKIESEWEKLNLSPEQLNALRQRMNEVTDEIQSRNPFSALSDAIKRYKSGEKGVTFKEIAKSASASIDLVKGSFDAVVNGFNELGISGDEVTQQLLGDISNLIASASELAMGIATGNPLQIIQGGIGVLTNAFKVFNTQDRKASRQIAQHAENLDKLQKSYNDLEKAIDKALGSGRYTETQRAVKNLEQQQRELARQAELERGKKKSDKDKVKEYENALQDAKDKQKELINQLREDILGIDAKSAAEQLGAAFVDAFRDGEDAVAAFGKKADDIVGNIMQKMLVQKLLEQPLGQIFDRYSKKWYSDNGDFIGFDAVIRDANAMGLEIKGIGAGFASAMDSLPDEIKKYFTGESATSDTNSWTGAIKGASEESVKFAAGQMNAIRINQLEASNLLRQQLTHLSVIAQNTAYNRYLKHLESIESRMARMESKDSLRSQGLQ